MNTKKIPNLLHAGLACLMAIGVLCASACNQPANNSSNPATATSATGDHKAHGAQSPSAIATPRVPDFHPDAASARPLPQTLSPEQFSTASVKAAYRIAQQYPEVLAQQPCYCYCDTGFGHKSLLDCHIDMHSAECMVCMKEAILAGRLHQQGRSAAEIREAIINGQWKDVPLE